MTRTTQYSDEEILEMLRRCKRQFGKCAPRDLEKLDDACSPSLVMRRFGGWTEAKRQAGIEEDLSSYTGRKKKYTNEQILKHLRELQRRHGKATIDTLKKEDDLVGSTVVTERFGSWSEGKRQAGIAEDERTKNSRPQEYSDEDYLELLGKCEEKHGKVTQRIFNDDDEFPSAGALRKRFGSWADAKRSAKLEVAPGPGNKKYGRERLISMLQECHDKHGKCTVRKFASDDEFCSPETVQREFGSWTEGLKAAGLD